VVQALERATAIGVTCSSVKECNPAARARKKTHGKMLPEWSFLIENKQVTDRRFGLAEAGDRSTASFPELGKTLTVAYERVFPEKARQNQVSGAKLSRSRSLLTLKLASEFASN
jgi:hypothetical protein